MFTLFSSLSVLPLIPLLPSFSFSFSPFPPHTIYAFLTPSLHSVFYLPSPLPPSFPRISPILPLPSLSSPPPHIYFLPSSPPFSLPLLPLVTLHSNFLSLLPSLPINIFLSFLHHSFVSFLYWFTLSPLLHPLHLLLHLYFTHPHLVWSR